MHRDKIARSRRDIPHAVKRPYNRRLEPGTLCRVSFCLLSVLDSESGREQPVPWSLKRTALSRGPWTMGRVALAMHAAHGGNPFPGLVLSFSSSGLRDNRESELCTWRMDHGAGAPWPF